MCADVAVLSGLRYGDTPDMNGLHATRPRFRDVIVLSEEARHLNVQVITVAGSAVLAVASRRPTVAITGDSFRGGNQAVKTTNLRWNK
jgi:hypothetical protein